MTAAIVPSDEDLVEITRQVWASYLDPDEIHPLVPGPVADRDTDLTAAVSITGAWHGRVFVSCSNAASEHAAAALLGVERDKVTKDDIEDALGELANIIGGNVKGMLPEPCALSLPEVRPGGPVSEPSLPEACELTGTWDDEPILIRVFGSGTETAE